MPSLRWRPLLVGPLFTAIVVGTGSTTALPIDSLTKSESEALSHHRSVSMQSCSIADDEFFATRPIDGSSCGLEGSGDAADKAQNALKNNLCAGGFLTNSPNADPVRVTQFSFKRLEEETKAIRAELGIAEGELPEAVDRDRFQQTIHTTVPNGDDLAEGTLVRYVGFLLEGHFTGEESVNCERKKQVNFDIHMAFVEQKPPANVGDGQAEGLECASITAELIPRRRPEEWDFLGRLKKTKKPGALKGAIAKIIAHDLHRPLRLTGQLFFDASHRVCVNGSRIGGQPARVSNWEIHPVYAIDVCKFTSLSSCKWDDDAVWKPLDVHMSEGDDQ
jgi:hypothetical protein